jgi:hypothetical protein
MDMWPAIPNRYWRRPTGRAERLAKAGVRRQRCWAFADPKFASLVEIRQSIALFGGVYIGLALPMTAQTQDVWDVVAQGGANAKPNSWGGHCVFVPKYDEKGFTCITWGQLKTMTLAFWKKYCDEAHTLLARIGSAPKARPTASTRRNCRPTWRSLCEGFQGLIDRGASKQRRRPARLPPKVI